MTVLVLHKSRQSAHYLFQSVQYNLIEAYGSVFFFLNDPNFLDLRLFFDPRYISIDRLRMHLFCS